MLDARKEEAFCTILREELQLATGCTEPIAVAYCAARLRQVLGATLYMACQDPKSGALLPGSTSCSMCRRLIINAGIARVVIRDTPTEYRVIDVQREWIDQDDSLPEGHKA